MAIEVVTDFRVLMRLARAVGQAEKSGDKEAIEKAKTALNAYKALCLRADRMNLGVSYGAI